MTSLPLGLGAWFSSWHDPWLWCSVTLLASCVANLEFHRRFQVSIRNAPRLDPLPGLPDVLPSLSVIIPAYNEAANITDVVESVLANELPTGAELQVIVADDDSDDETLELAEMVAEKDSRVVVFTVSPRPTDQTWRGKNWACVQAAKQATGEYVLFLDADVRLDNDAIATTLANAQTYQTDLLSCAPRLTCGCFSEWLVQPLMALLIAVGFSFKGVNDPDQINKAAAAGPFMLFRRCGYDKIGGHAAVATEAVEDFALAREIKTNGLKLRYVLGTDVASLRMYRSFAGLWEGWTKNFHIAGGRNIAVTLGSAGAIALLFVVPWLGLPVGTGGILLGASGVITMASPMAIPIVAVLVFSVLAIACQLYMRLSAAATIGQPLRYLYLGWLGGGIISAIAITSLIKTETGWGWTWKGRSLR